MPHLQLLLAPVTPTGTAASSSAPFRTGIAAADRFVGRLGLRAVHTASAAPVAETRRALGLPDWRPRDHVSAWLATPVVYGFSPHVVPVATDWPEHTAVTGYWHDDEPPSPPVRPPVLDEFLESSADLVYIGFGSMLDGLDVEATVELAREAVRIAGVRGVVAAPRPAPIVTTDGRTCLVGDVGHGWLFPQMRAVVHHGGAGTTSQALRAGVPSTAVPRLGDQPYWGRRLAELGVGMPPLDPKHLDAARLAAAIRGMLDDPAMARRARTLGDLLRAEAGADRAADAIVGVLRGDGPGR